MKIINESILKVQSGIICHGVNCQKVMGAGLAKDLRKAYPVIYDQFKQTEGELGHVDFVEIGELIENKPPLIIANCYTQYFYGKMMPYKGANHHFSYEALHTVCNTIFEYASTHQYPIHWPKIGCGLAGGEWTKVKEIIESYEKKFNWEQSFLWSVKQ